MNSSSGGRGSSGSSLPAWASEATSVFTKLLTPLLPSPDSAELAAAIFIELCDEQRPDTEEEVRILVGEAVSCSGESDELEAVVLEMLGDELAARNLAPPASYGTAVKNAGGLSLLPGSACLAVLPQDGEWHEATVVAVHEVKSEVEGEREEEEEGEGEDESEGEIESNTQQKKKKEEKKKKDESKKLQLEKKQRRKQKKGLKVQQTVHSSVTAATTVDAATLQLHVVVTVSFDEFPEVPPVRVPIVNVIAMEALPDATGGKDVGDGDCAICQRRMKLTAHHLIPRSTHGKHYNRERSTRELASTIDVCRACHNVIHAAETNDVLAREYNTLEHLLQHPNVIKWQRFAVGLKKNTSWDHAVGNR